MIQKEIVTTHPLNPRTSPINPPNPQKTPNAPPNFRLCPVPISANSDASPANSDASPANSDASPANSDASPANSDASPANSDASPANSDASPANSDSPLANFGAFPAATDTYPGSPKPREPPPLFLIFATHHQLNTLVPPTYSGYISCRVALRTLVLILLNVTYVSRSYLSLSVLSQSPGLVLSPFCYRSHYHFVSPLKSTLVPYQPHSILSDAVSVTPSGRCAQVFTNLNDLMNSAIMITNPDTPSPGLNLALRSVPDFINSK
ncbi:hypothetical protein J132_10017 [Termitomyces sp. J132]|nr:hypothetical protein J132_10017 [Termitomyces sp. J132]